MILVKLSSCGNPDFRQDSKREYSPTLFVEVPTMEEASGICKEYIAEWDLGGGNWSGGQVYDDKKQIARISYNGRIWDLNGNEKEEHGQEKIDC